jgi:hypothetical protein
MNRKFQRSARRRSMNDLVRTPPNLPYLLPESPND